MEDKEQFFKEPEELQQRLAELEKREAKSQQTQKELQHLASIPQLNPNPIIEIDSTGAITFFNAAASRFLQRSRVQGAHHFLPSDLSGVIGEVKEKGKSHREVKIKNTIFWEEIFYNPQFDTIHIYAINISARKRVEDQLQQHREQLEEMVNARTAALQKANALLKAEINERHRMAGEIKRLNHHNEMILACAGEGIFGLNSEGLTTFANPAAVQMLGWEIEELIGKAQHEIIHHTKPNGTPYPQRECPIYASSRDGQVHHVDDEVFWKKDGTSFAVEYTSTPIHDGELSGAVVVFRDITNRKKTEEALAVFAQKWQATFDAISDGIFLLDQENEIVQCNQAMINILHKSEKDIIGFHCWEIIHGILAPVDGCPMARVKKTGKREHLRLPLDSRWFDIIVDPILDAAGTFLGAVHIMSDVTERKMAEEQMRKLSTAVEQATDWVVITNKNGEIDYANKTVSEITGYTPEELLGKSTNILKSGEHDDEFYKHLWNNILSGNPYRNLFINRKKNGELFYLDMTITPLKDELGNIIQFLSTAKDVTHQKYMEERLHYLAYYDHLTGLPNRALFLDRLKQALARAAHNKKNIAIVSLGLDCFKLVNESLGSDQGDEILKKIAGRLSQCVREGDTVARFGNDEFCLALVDILHADDVILLVEKIMENIRQTMSTQGGEVILTCSMGISIFPQDGQTALDLIRNGEAACNKVKELGGNNYQFYTPGMNAKAADFLFLERQLFNAIKQEEFVLHYQPYFQVHKGEMVGMEALIRWQNPKEGLVPPGKFIPVLEDSGMIREVCEWTLRESCRQIKEWQNNGYSVVPVSINFSPVQFRWPNLSDIVKRVMEEYRIDPKFIIAEITESAVMQDIEITRSVLKKFKDLGMSVSIDDFGTGHSSLSYLKKFPLDNLKIDISFIKDITTDPDAASIVNAIISMAHNLDLKTIAEGAETKEQVQILRLLRCDIIQGFYFSKPLPALEISKRFFLPSLDRQAKDSLPLCP